ncbi:MAG: hypothetical protein ACI9JY_001004, partial [Saprospiraceae bacterium]
LQKTARYFRKKVRKNAIFVNFSPTSSNALYQNNVLLHAVFLSIIKINFGNV